MIIGKVPSQDTSDTGDSHLWPLGWGSGRVPQWTRVNPLLCSCSWSPLEAFAQCLAHGSWPGGHQTQSYNNTMAYMKVNKTYILFTYTLFAVTLKRGNTRTWMSRYAISSLFVTKRYNFRHGGSDWIRPAVSWLLSLHVFHVYNGMWTSLLLLSCIARQGQDVRWGCLFSALSKYII